MKYERRAQAAVGAAVLAVMLAACAPAPGPPAAAPAAPARAAAGGEASTAGAPSPPPRVQIRVPHSTRSAGHLTMWLPLETGLYAQHGLDVESDYIPTSTVLTQGLMAGEYQLASSSQEATVSANLAGSDVVLIAAGVDRLAFALHTRPEITAVGGLRGQRLGITRFGTGTDFAARTWLRRQGLEPEREVPLVPVGGQPELWAALQAGAVDGAILAVPLTALARRAGYPELVDYSALDVPFHLQAIVSTRRYVDEQPAVVRAFLHAYAEGLARVRADPAGTRELLARFTGVDDPEAVEEGYQLLLRSSTVAPRLRREAIQAGLDHLALTNPAAVGAPVEQFVDTRILDALEQEGVLARLGL